MERIDYLTAQASLAKTMRRVCENQQAVTIDGAGKDQVVMLSLSEYQRVRACLHAQEVNQTVDSTQKQKR